MTISPRPGLVLGFLTILATAAVLLWPSSRAESTSTTRSVRFTTWGMPFEDRLFLDRYARGFEAAHPGISVDYQRHSDPNLKYNAWHFRGSGAEVMRVMVTDYHQMVARGMLKPLDEYINHPALGLSASQLADFPQELLSDLKVDGKLYALPQDIGVYGLYYNRDLFDQHNRDHPNNTIPYPTAGWTWQDLRRAAIALTRRDAQGNITQYGLDLSIWQWPFMNFFAQAGGQQWRTEPSGERLTTLVNSPAGVETLEFLRTLAHVDRVWDPYFGREQGVGPDSRFTTGRTAMYLDGSWMIPNFEARNPDLNFAVAPVPRHRANAVVGGSCLWGISSSAANPDDAWLMIRWLVAPAQAAQYWDTLRVAPPASRAVVFSDAFTSTTGIPRQGRPGEYDTLPMPRERFDLRAAWLLEAFTPDPATQRLRVFVPTSLYQRTLEDELARMLQDFLRSPDRISPQDALARVERAVHEVIDRDRKARSLPPAVR